MTAAKGDARFDAVVVGSGFGGAVAACRLAQAGLGVCVLERGRRYAEGGFPRAPHLTSGWLFRDQDRGMCDLKPVATELLVLQAAGWGGGSLLYSNVHMRAPADLFASGWPEGYSRAALDPYYDLVAYMLDVQPIAASQPRGLAPKTHRLREAATVMDREAQFFLPNLAIDFGPPGEAHQNRFGVEQRGCVHCGECNVGCNHRAKNTLDLNYLALAERHGAVARTECQVSRIEPVEGGYRVTYQDLGADAEVVVETRWVFLCAGSVNSTEMLLRNRDVLGTLPNLGHSLGHQYSGNGDFLAVAYGLREPGAPSTGPVITSALAYRREGEDSAWMLVEDGGSTPLIDLVAEACDPGNSLYDEVSLLWDDIPRRALALRPSHDGEDERVQHCLPLLGMGRDASDGQLYIDTSSGHLRLRFPLASNLPLYGVESRLCTDVAKALGGEVAFNPLWRLLHQPITVHSLGGCPMADDPTRGVLDGHGEAYGHPGLFVLDGAALPTATGTNPASTIAAVAERNIERFIRRVTSNDAWQAPERAHAVPVAEPLDGVVFPHGGSRAPSTVPVGVAFRETMSGHLHLGHDPAGDYRGGERDGAAAGFTLDIKALDLDAFLRDPNHTAVAHGTLHVAGLTPERGAPVTAGVFNLLSPGDRPHERHFRYLLPFYGADGAPYLLDGHKDLTGAHATDAWAELSTLYTVVRAGHGLGGAVVASGILRFHLTGVPEMVRSLSITGPAGLPEKASATERFGSAIFGTLWDVYGKLHL
jgi:cholesterol oxidase